MLWKEVKWSQKFLHLGQLRRKHKKFLNSKTAQPPHKPVQIYFIKIAGRTTYIQRNLISKKLRTTTNDSRLSSLYSSDDQMHLVFHKNSSPHDLYTTKIWFQEARTTTNDSGLSSLLQFWWSNAFSVCCEKKSSEAKGFLTRWRGEKEVVVMARGQSFTLFYVRHASDMK
jgi:hypothetical protein